MKWTRTITMTMGCCIILLLSPFIAQGQNSGLHSRIFRKQEVEVKNPFSALLDIRNELYVFQITKISLLGIVCSIVAVATSVLCTVKFLKTTELAFVARLAMASEIGNDGAAGDSGVLQSINISSDSPSAISDSFLVDQKPLQVQRTTEIFCWKIGIYYYLYAIHPYNIPR